MTDVLDLHHGVNWHIEVCRENLKELEEYWSNDKHKDAVTSCRWLINYAMELEKELEKENEN